VGGGGSPTFGAGECARRHEERLNGGRLCLLLAANATSVSMALHHPTDPPLSSVQT